MAQPHFRHSDFHLHRKAPHQAAMPFISDVTTPQLPDLTRRQATSTCSANDNSGACEKPVSNSTFTTPIIAGVVVPVVFAMVLLLFLQRRHVRNQRREDANDRLKDLDFGVDSSASSKRNKKTKQPHPTVMLEKPLQRGRGMSLDLGNPYMLPPGLQSSRESLHSLSRTLQQGHDPYRPATTFFPGDASVKSYPNSRLGGDDSSSYTGSSIAGNKSNSSTHNLVMNAQSMPRSQQAGPYQVLPPITEPVQAQSPPRKGLPANPREGLAPKPAPLVRDSYITTEGAAFRKSNNYLAGFIHSRDPSMEQAQNTSQHNAVQNYGELSALPQTIERSEACKSPLPTVSTTYDPPPPLRKESLSAQPPPIFTEQQYEFNNQNRHSYIQNIVPPSPDANHTSYHSDMYGYDGAYSTAGEDIETRFYTPGDAESSTFHGGLDVNFDDRRMSILRPLPPDDPLDNPEQRANRIRSFYKEYFNENEPARAYAPAPAAYYEDYSQEYQGNGTVYDPASHQFVVAQAPYAEPVTRRAMTPPPRAPPRYQGPGQHQYQSSNPAPMGPPRARAFSSASNAARFGPAGPPPRGAVRQRLPPPAPLRNLPTPHLLQEDAFALPIDFAPPTTYRDRQAGRPESPRLQMRPFSPAVSVHNPLQSSFDELPVMPSPHLLRKSGTFTALDFAPPPRFKNSDAGSDAGSIRSGRSAHSTMSAAQQHSIRTGAYRVSRIPKEVVGTKFEFNESLRPRMDMNR